MLKINKLKLIAIFLLQGLFGPSGFCQYGPYVYTTHEKTAMAVLSPKINLNTFLLQSGFSPERFGLNQDRQDLQEKEWLNYLISEQLSDYPELIKLFTPQMRELLLNDQALKPVFMRLLPDEHKGPIEVLDFGAAKEFGGIPALEQILKRFSGFQEKNLKLAEALAEKGEIVIGCTDRYSNNTMQYAVANNRQMYFPLADGTFIGVKGSGQNSGGLQFGHSVKDTRQPFYINKRKNGGRVEGVLTIEEIAFALKAAELLPSNFNGSFIQFLGYQKLYALPFGDNWLEFDEIGIAFYHVLTPHRLTKLPQLLKTDPELNYLRRSLSLAMDRFGMLPLDMPKETILSSEQLISLIVKNMGAGEAYKQNNLLFKMVLHAQDINWSGQECDLEEILWDEAYGENLHADIALEKQDRDFMLYSHEELVVRDIRQKLKIIAELAEHSGKYRNELFPYPQKVLETFFQAYFSGLNDSNLARFVSLNDLPQKKYAPTDVIVDLLDQKVFSYLGNKQEIKTLITKLASEELSKRNSAAINNNFSIPAEYYADWVSVAIRRLTHGKMVWGYLDHVLVKYRAGFIEELRSSIKAKQGNPKDWARLFEDLFIEIKQEINSQNIADEALRNNLVLIDAAINFLHGNKQNQEIDLDELLLEIYKNIPVIVRPNIQGDPIGKISGNNYDLLSAFANILNNFIAGSYQLYADKKISYPEYTDMQLKGRGFLIKKKIENGFAVIEFQDVLGGIPEEFLIPGKYNFNGKQYPKIFDYGFSGRDGGTGIGLAETLFVIMMHGGDIDIISTPGKGTTFVIKLPLNSNIIKNSLSDELADVFSKSIDQQLLDLEFPQLTLQSI